MVERDGHCVDLMKQVAALQASLEKVNRLLLQNHLETCVTEAIQSGGGDAEIRELIDALRYNRGLTDFSQSAEPLAIGEAPWAPRGAGPRGARGQRHDQRVVRAPRRAGR